MLKLSTILCLSAVLVSQAEAFVLSEKCFWNNNCPYLYLSTKTMYEVIRGDIRDNSNELPTACTPVALWTLHRHGTRRAGNGVTDDMRQVSSLLQHILESHQAGRGRLCSQDAENLRKWTWDSEQDNTITYLTESGYQELFDIARRLKEKYPQLFSKYDEDVHYMRPTNEQRTIMSSIAYAEGLFGANLTSVVDSPRLGDDVIRPYEFCERWQNEVRNNNDRSIQMELYYQSDDYKKVINSVQQLTGIDYQLSHEDVYAMFELCRFEKSWSPKEISPWCALFTAEDLEIIEYLDDLRHYYRNGYGSHLNAKLGAMTLKDLYETFENVTLQGNSRVVSYFTHDTMLEMVFTAMGLFDDGAPLMAQERKPERAWRTTFISPFAVNMMVTLNRCADREYRVAFYVNEVPIKVPGCSGTNWCSWREFQQKFQPFVHSNLDFCHYNT